MVTKSRRIVSPNSAREPYSASALTEYANSYSSTIHHTYTFTNAGYRVHADRAVKPVRHRMVPLASELSFVWSHMRHTATMRNGRSYNPANKAGVRSYENAHVGFGDKQATV
jgi:hypothetical protein